MFFVFFLLSGKQNLLLFFLGRWRNVCVWQLGSLKIVFAVKRCKNENRFCTILWFCVMDRYRTLCFAYWTGTGMFAFGSWQGAVRFQWLEFTVANVGTRGYLCKNFRFLKVGTDGSQRGNKMFHHGKELPVPRPWNLRLPTWEPEVTIARNCLIQEIRISVFEATGQSF